MKLVSNILIDSACCLKLFSMDKEDILDLFYVLLVLHLLKWAKYQLFAPLLERVNACGGSSCILQ